MLPLIPKQWQLRLVLPFLDIFQLPVIIIITFNVIWNVLDEQQVIFEFHRAAVMLACL